MHMVYVLMNYYDIVPYEYHAYNYGAFVMITAMMDIDAHVHVLLVTMHGELCDTHICTVYKLNLNTPLKQSVLL